MEVRRPRSVTVPPTTTTVATGALGPVLSKLTALLGLGDDQQHRFASAGCRRDDVEFIASKLEEVRSLLLTMWNSQEEDLGAACKDWVAEARDLSYAVEDDVDDLVHGGGAGSPFEGLRDRIQRLLTRCSSDEWWKATAGSRPGKKPVSTVLDGKSASPELVEMDEKRRQLVGRLRTCWTVCVVGPAGIGKTTLAQVACRAVAERFQCRAFVSSAAAASASPGRRRPSTARLLMAVLGQLLLSAANSVAAAADDDDDDDELSAAAATTGDGSSGVASVQRMKYSSNSSSRTEEGQLKVGGGSLMMI